jgi:hypothetical protein
MLPNLHYNDKFHSSVPINSHVYVHLVPGFPFSRVFSYAILVQLFVYYYWPQKNRINQLSPALMHVGLLPAPYPDHRKNVDVNSLHDMIAWIHMHV